MGDVATWPLKPVMTAQQVELVPFSEDHIHQAYVGWLRDESVTRYIAKARTDIRFEEVAAFGREMIHSKVDVFYAILDKTTKHHIGNARIGPIDWVNGYTNFGMLIGDAQFHGRGIGTEVMGLIKSVCFDHLNLKTLTFPVVEDNIAAMRIYEKSGFTRLGYGTPFVKDKRELPCVMFSFTKDAYRQTNASE